ncbi:hypothetical protein [Phytoactinopolyspora mesophila]|uniref:Polyketide cyclase n=1 Tax=Phytoactinopolyspora mesophila TaxID=2650750 RepID=A0A7K3M1V7_9ACTN|nr:hypothetical protein [Phytoactinopolyspora mesophila]NDL57285.1 hypothetical protein [Phytoactinopolyspora mesophila]
MKPRSYQFGSVWVVAVPLSRCWDFLTSPGQRWFDWWPRLREIEIQRTSRLVGSRAVCTWKSPLGYRLRTSLLVTEVVEGTRVRMAAGGDLTGLAEVALSELPGGGTRIDVTWWVHTTRTWMNLLAPALRPLFLLGHRAVMRGGERGLRQALAAESPG